MDWIQSNHEFQVGLNPVQGGQALVQPEQKFSKKTADKVTIVLGRQKSFKILKYHLNLEFWALKFFLISYVFVSEVGLIPVQPGLNPVQGGPIVVHPGLDSVLSRVSSTVIPYLS